ncbi:MAG: GNAT family N-acetyltransferase [bacterium]|nr:GNAT family N-acetyltransferase [bacterium]
MTATDPTGQRRDSAELLSDRPAGDGFTLTLHLRFRAARLDDLPKLEWYGQYAHFRNLFRKTFREQQKGRRLMLIAECNQFPVGHIFMQTGSEKPYCTYFYSFRVMEHFRGCGIGTRLIQEAETIALTYGYRRAAIAAAKDNPGARRLYERMGYQVMGEDAGRWSYVDHENRVRHVHEPCWVLEKSLVIR